MSDPIIRIVVEDQSPPGPQSSSPPGGVAQPTPGGAPPSSSGVQGGGPASIVPSGSSPSEGQSTAGTPRRPSHVPFAQPSGLQNVESRIVNFVEQFFRQAVRYQFPGGLGSFQSLFNAFPRAGEQMASGVQGVTGAIGGKEIGQSIGNALRRVMGIEEQISGHVAKIAQQMGREGSEKHAEREARKTEESQSSTRRTELQANKTSLEPQSSGKPISTGEPKNTPIQPQSDVQGALGKGSSSFDSNGTQQGQSGIPPGIGQAGANYVKNAGQSSSTGFETTGAQAAGVAEEGVATGAAETAGAAATEGAVEAGVLAGGAALGPPGLIAAVAVIALGEAANIAVGAIKKLADSFLAKAKQLEQFSPQIGMAEARADIRQLQFQYHEARELGPALSRLVEAQSQASINMKESLLPFEKKLAELAAGGMEAWKEFTEIIKGISDSTKWIREKLGFKDEAPPGNYNELMDRFFSMGAGLGDTMADEFAPPSPPGLKGGKGGGI